MGIQIGILVFGYNRPEMLERQINFAISTKLNVYVHIDGPKSDTIISNAKCVDIVERYRNEITDYSVSLLNKGCNLAVTDAITWAFKFEEALIILEDDVVIDENFTKFASIALNMYKSNYRVGGISAMSLVPNGELTHPTLDYRLTCFTSSWGWATWRDRWDSHLHVKASFPIWKWDFPKYFWTPARKVVWKSFFAKTISGEYDAWDFRWQFTNWKSHWLTIVPNRNLGLNLGFGPEATHTNTRDIPTWLPHIIESMPGAITEIEILEPDLKADRWMARKHYGATLNNYFRITLGSRFPFFRTFNSWIQSYFNR